MTLSTNGEYRNNARRIRTNNNKNCNNNNNNNKRTCESSCKKTQQSTDFVTLQCYHEISVKIARNSFPVREFEMFNCCRLSLQDRSKEGSGYFRRAPGVGCCECGLRVKLLRLCRPEFPRGSGVSRGLRASHRTE